MKLETVEYVGINCIGEVAYLILKDGTCVITYSRLVSGSMWLEKATSTINAIEDIVKAICKKERRKPKGLVFYDLQTSRAYKQKPGQFVFDRITFTNGNPSWNQVVCPPRIVDAFRAFIGPNAQQVTNRGLPFQGLPS